MSIIEFDHINIRTANITAMTSFYAEVLGLKEGWRPEKEENACYRAKMLPQLPQPTRRAGYRMADKEGRYRDRYH